MHQAAIIQLTLKFSPPASLTSPASSSSRAVASAVCVYKSETCLIIRCKSPCEYELMPFCGCIFAVVTWPNDRVSCWAQALIANFGTSPLFHLWCCILHKLSSISKTVLTSLRRQMWTASRDQFRHHYGAAHSIAHRVQASPDR